MFAHVFHIRSWEFDRLSVEDLATYRHEADAWIKAQSESGGAG